MTLSAFGRYAAALLAGTALMAAGAARAQTTCQLAQPGSKIQHIVYVVFDNVHLRRDNPNVPSDLEQMPNLKNFLTSNGALSSNHHPVLISHTANDILTGLAGVYSNRLGSSVANSFRYFNPDGTTNPASSFAYWTDPLYDFTTPTPTDTTPEMIDENGVTAPAPWVAYTRAGCDFGAAGAANVALENIATDISTVFGPNSPQALEAKNNSSQAYADFVGIAIHCAQASTRCAAGQPDLLPAEPGGYTGYNGLFGHAEVQPAVSPGGPILDLSGAPILGSTGVPGFPGFDGMVPNVSLGYVATMLKAGVPVVYAYVSDAHDNHQLGQAYGPGQAGYVAQLQSFDAALGAFFTNLSAAGINQTNTLFMFTSDEGDHFVGGPPSPAGCDGVTTPCTYAQIGEINADLGRLVATERNNATPFLVHSDDAPAIWITGQTAQTSFITRGLEQDLFQVKAVDPLTNVNTRIAVAEADQTELAFLHMISADPLRNPTFVQFNNPDFYTFSTRTSPPPLCVPVSACVSEQPNFAWNHGDYQKDISTDWVGIVGPGVAHRGATGAVWSDSVDLRPTILTLAKLSDDYVHDGRPLFELFDHDALPATVLQNLAQWQKLAEVYKSINAPLQGLALHTLRVSTRAITSADPTYAAIEAQLQTLTTNRDAVAAQIKQAVDIAFFQGGTVDAATLASLTAQAAAVLQQGQAL